MYTTIIDISRRNDDDVFPTTLVLSSKQNIKPTDAVCFFTYK